VVPKGVMNLWKDHKSPATKRAFAAMMDMKKLDIAELKAAYKGK
jgi:predicted 3-demethylubiquinone-9 3-methyltransferase (glyoxalase superfamily)